MIFFGGVARSAKWLRFHALTKSALQEGSILSLLVWGGWGGGQS